MIHYNKNCIFSLVVIILGKFWKDHKKQQQSREGTHVFEEGPLTALSLFTPSQGDPVRFSIASSSHASSCLQTPTIAPFPQEWQLILQICAQNSLYQGNTATSPLEHLLFKVLCVYVCVFKESMTIYVYMLMSSVP